MKERLARFLKRKPKPCDRQPREGRWFVVAELPPMSPGLPFNEPLDDPPADDEHPEETL